MKARRQGGKAAGWVRLRREVAAAARELVRRDLTRGTSGNVSVRAGRGMLITCSALDYDRMRPADVVDMTLAGVPKRGSRKPSTEWRMHAGIYEARPDVAAIVHAHPPYATTLACLGKPIPPLHYMIAVAGGSDIRCAGYAPFGTAALARLATKALAGRKACLLANHGILALGSTLEEALGMAEEIEFLAGVYWRTLAIGRPKLLDARQMADARGRFATYKDGRRRAARRQGGRAAGD